MATPASRPWRACAPPSRKRWSKAYRPTSRCTASSWSTPSSSRAAPASTTSKAGSISTSAEAAPAMHALTVLVEAASADAVSDLLSDEHGALSVSIEDADAGSPEEQPVFDEPGIDQRGGWRRARLNALFD